jgi:hypothetical protein
MSSHDMIDSYLVELRAALQGHPHVDDLVAEAADHLVECTGRLESTGHDRSTAQALALERYGDPSVVARAFAKAGGIAMPTKTARVAGAAALWAAAGWLGLAVGVFPYLATVMWFSDDGWSGAWVLMVSLAGASTTAGTLVLLHGLLLRGAGSYSGTAYLSMGLGIAALVLLTLVTWAWPFGVVPLAIAFALAVRRVNASFAGTGSADWLLAIGWPVGCALYLVLETLGFGPVAEFGNYPWANAAGFLVGAVLFSAGLVRIGLRLRHEEPDAQPAAIAMD